VDDDFGRDADWSMAVRRRGRHARPRLTSVY